MGFRSQLQGGIRQLHEFFSNEQDPCSIMGRTFKPVSGRKGREKRIGDAGFIAAFDASFTASNVDIAGLSLPQTIGAILTQSGTNYMVRRYEDGPLTTVFYCDAKTS